MKRLLLLSSMIVLVLPDMAVALQAQDRPRPQRPGASQPQRPPQGARPPATRPPDTRPPQRPSPAPTARPPQRPPAARPPQRPPQRPPAARPPQHHPGQGRPPSFRPIQRPGWNYPRGWGYRRWRPGLVLPALFWGNRYFFNDFGLLGLGAPPPGYMWVRYGPDLLLVRRSDRRIVDVIYGAFF